MLKMWVKCSSISCVVTVSPATAQKVYYEIHMDKSDVGWGECREVYVCMGVEIVGSKPSS